jgi:hypothetical protein
VTPRSQNVKDVNASYDALLNLFESIGNFAQRLDIYTKIPLTPVMKNMVVVIMVELLSILAVATKEIKQGPLSKSISLNRSLSSRRRREIWHEAVWRQ